MKQNQSTSKAKATKKVKSLRYCHAATAGLSIFCILAILFIDNWSEMLVWLSFPVTIFFDGKFEKNDELAKQNLSKANAICMWVMIAAISILGIYARHRAIGADVFPFIVFGSLALRSILFLIYDAPFGAKVETDA